MKYDFVNSGQTSSGLLIGGGTYLAVLSGGAIVNTTVASDGQVGVVGSATSSVVLNGGYQEIDSGGYSTSTMVSSGGDESVVGTGIAVGTVVSDGGHQETNIGGTASKTVVLEGGSRTSVTARSHPVQSAPRPLAWIPF